MGRIAFRTKEDYLEDYITEPFRRAEICGEVLAKKQDRDWIVENDEIIYEINEVVSALLRGCYTGSKEAWALELINVLKSKAVDYFEKDIDSIISDEAHEAYREDLNEAFYADEETD